MPFDPSNIEAQLDMLEWRDSQLEKINVQLEDEFDGLLDSIEKHVDGMSIWEVTEALTNMNPLAEELLHPWMTNQSQILMTRAEESLEELMGKFGENFQTDNNLEHLLPAAFGVGLIATSIAAVPGVVSFATVPSTVLVVFSTSVISMPLLIAGGAVMAIMAFTGVKALDYAKDQAYSRLVSRLQAYALVAVFGYGQKPDALCLLNYLQAAVIESARNRIEKGT